MMVGCQDPLVVSSQQEEDDLAKAIQLSLQENKVPKTTKSKENFNSDNFRDQTRLHLPPLQMAAVLFILWRALGTFLLDSESLSSPCKLL